MSPLPKRAFIAITSAQAELFEGGGHTTGVFIGEALHPYNVFKDAGFEVDLASETGSWTQDWLSLQPGFLTEAERAQYDDPASEFRKKLDAHIKASDLNPADYSIFYASAGHAALIDYPTAEGVKDIARGVWEKGGVVVTVCHGPAIFPGINDKKTGRSIVEGKRITGFTTEAEGSMGLADTLKKWDRPLIDEWAEKLGATYVRPDGVWDDYFVTDGRIVTGLNPQSATSTAKEALKVFESL